MAIDERATLLDVAFTVCTVLDRLGTIAVLTGGSAATYYASAHYQSMDADFVFVTRAGDDTNAASAMRDLGFTELGGIYRHPKTRFTVEFPPGPLALGHELQKEYETIRRHDEVLHVLSRTQSTMDRLLQFYHWGDRSALRVALAVASGGPIDLRRIERWSDGERSREKFLEFARRFEEQPPQEDR